jgi:hypothetical protein
MAAAVGRDLSLSTISVEERAGLREVIARLRADRPGLDIQPMAIYSALVEWGGDVERTTQFFMNPPPVPRASTTDLEAWIERTVPADEFPVNDPLADEENYRRAGTRWGLFGRALIDACGRTVYNSLEADLSIACVGGYPGRDPDRSTMSVSQVDVLIVAARLTVRYAGTIFSPLPH